MALFFLSLRKMKQQALGTYIREEEVNRPQHEEDKWMICIDSNRTKAVSIPAPKTHFQEFLTNQYADVLKYLLNGTALVVFVLTEFPNRGGFISRKKKKVVLSKQEEKASSHVFHACSDTVFPKARSPTCWLF